MNKVRKSNQIDITMEGLHTLRKYSWICCVCNTEYALRHDAQICNHYEWKIVDGIGYAWVSRIDGSIRDNR
jgi:hypothetical protein